MARRTFEQLAIENGVVTDEQVSECRSMQDEQQLRGEAVTPIEKLLVEKGYLTEDQLRAVNTAMTRLQKDEERGDFVRIGGYDITGKLGDGGLGTVYKARQISMSRDVALKVLHKKWLADEEFKKRFLLEARLAGRLSHQNLIQVYDVGRDRGLYYFSMEFVDGETLEDMIEREGPLDIPRAMDVTLQVLRAVTYIKRFDIVHRDIKPSNVMINRSGLVKLGDFGFVKSKIDHAISTEGEVLGTPDYISPEQAMGMENIDWRSDQYSLGCSLYHQLTGKPPYEGSGSAVMRQHIKADLPDPRIYNAKLPESVVQLMEKMLAKDPNDRYQTTQELFEDLELIKMGQDPAAQRLDAGKSTIIRAFKAEQVKAKRAKNEVEILQDELNRMRRFMIGAFILAGMLMIALVLVLAWLAFRKGFT
jgi:eukaryotic-like serine/threonine-protein kinase